MGRVIQLQKFSLKKTVGSNDLKTAAEFLARHSDISKRRIKEAMNKGAVWLKKTKGKQSRIRRAMTALKTGDNLSFYYDEKLLALEPPTAETWLKKTQRYNSNPAGRQI